MVSQPIEADVNPQESGRSARNLPGRIETCSRVREALDSILKLLVLIHEERRDILAKENPLVKVAEAGEVVAIVPQLRSKT